MKNTLKQNGFTLTELIVVIAIITVMVAILLPALAAVHKMALNIQCKSNMRQVGVFYDNFMQDFDGYLPPNWNFAASSSYHQYAPTEIGWDAKFWSWGASIQKAGYVGKGEYSVLKCPTLNNYANKNSSKYYTQYTYASERHRRLARPGQLSWGGEHLNGPGDMTEYPKNMDYCYILADSQYKTGGKRVQAYFIQSAKYSSSSGRTIHTRHMGTANLLFLDGHVDAFSGKELIDKNKFELNHSTNYFPRIYPNP